MRPPSIQQERRVYVILGGNLSLVCRPYGEPSHKMSSLVRERTFDYARGGVPMVEKGTCESTGNRDGDDTAC